MKRLLTTPIYYVNDVPHIGHAYTTILADVMKKYWSLKGDDVFLLTGTDEHGQKIEEAAKKHGIKTIEYANSISEKFRNTWREYDIDYDKFIRTTYFEHILSVQKAFEIMYDRGDIYKGAYEGMYCVGCESFFTQSQVIDGIYCPDCSGKKETRLVKEESYFFALSKYQDKLLKWYKENPNCIIPSHKKNEVIKFVEQGLQDLSITRISFEWGIKIPLKLRDSKHIIYVWLDALMNYASALGYGLDYNNAKEQLSYKMEQNPCLESKMEYFNNTTHIVGKDILRFHAIYWPAFLMSLDLPLPKHIFVHGWWTIDGVKMSKSIGNVIHPLDIKNAYPTDIFRYFLLREVPFGQDGDFSQVALINRNNGELSNDLGNLLNRLIGMSEKYFQFDLTQSYAANANIPQKEEISRIINQSLAYMDSMQPHKFLESVWELFSLANTMITQVSPWELMKQDKTTECRAFLNLIANLIAKAALLLYPVLPNACKKISEALNINIDSKHFDMLINKHEYIHDFTIKKVCALFPKIEEPRMKTIHQPFAENKPQETTDIVDDSCMNDLINIEYFQQVVIKVGTIISAEKLPKSKKLLKLQVDLGEEKLRQIIAGIAEFYDAENLVGTQVCVLANLAPAKLMGEISQGMILACKDTNGLSLLRTEHARLNGSRIS
ncbi:methionine--tRNA ligase [Helicobacter trogontum]|uniref:Methionine--tRNA ligase n=1 Tax=Helicobacter trogontum TaxID=50960 RepID=A0ABQ0D500_9HELI|nr:methionine--tRNA ligase [Helicobacter trogontum]MCI5785966.1 methionine--tRNA ligase [Helicobacter trogontum]MDY5185323.1 methionine--tRNA ligase [Helicobacter trogontum]